MPGSSTVRSAAVCCRSCAAPRSKNMGIQQLMDAVIMCLPSPVERAGIVAIKGTDPKTGSEIMRKPHPEEPLAALVFKTIIDPFAGKLSVVRVFSGTLKSDHAVYNSTKQVKEKIGSLFLLQGKKQVPMQSLAAGQIGAIAKMKETLTGDTLCAEAQPIVLEFAKFIDPVMSFAIEPQFPGRRRQGEHRHPQASGRGPDAPFHL